MRRTGIKSVCGECGRAFSGVIAFDRHRIGEFSVKKLDSQGRFLGWTHTRHCMDQAEIDKHFTLNAKGLYVLMKNH